MSHLSNQSIGNASLRTVAIGVSILSLSLPSWAQSEPISDKKPTAAASCDSSVAPIKRTKKPATLTKAPAVDWTTMASTYSHDPSGQRVDQYATPVEPQSNERPDFVRSGFRHSRSTLQAGFSSDNYHVTESWGQPVRPYGEWRYPNRPFSVPYGQWGPQLPQVVVGGNQFGAIGPWGFNPNMNPNAFGNNAGINAGAANNAAFANGQFQGNAIESGDFHGNSGFNGNQSVAPAGANWPGQGAWGARPWSGFGNGQSFGPPNGMGQGFGVGPQNALPAGQDEYYPQAPIYHPMPDDGFRSPFRN